MKQTTMKVSSFVLAVSVLLGGVLVLPVNAQDFGEKPGCGAAGCPGGNFISQLVGWFGQYSIWSAIAAAIFGFGYWAWSKGSGGGYGMAAGQRYILAGFGGIAGISLTTSIAQTLWNAAAGG